MDSKTRLQIIGYDLLGACGQDGLRYAWSVDESRAFLESAAFINKTRGIKNDISGYTTSVSHGCILRQVDINVHSAGPAISCPSQDS